MAKINFLKLAVKAAEIADDKKAINTIILDVRDITAIVNYFVITTADSIPQINAISGEIEKAFNEQDIKLLRKEGVYSTSWQVIDYGGLVIHIMSPSIRELYKLEKLWDNAKTVQPKKLKVISEKENDDIVKIKTPKTRRKIIKRTKIK
jgi:ribosome-associated protein